MKNNTNRLKKIMDILVKIKIIPKSYILIAIDKGSDDTNINVCASVNKEDSMKILRTVIKKVEVQ